MNSDNILALALAALIGLLTLVVPPWSGLWWLGVISALLAAGWALIDIPLRRFEIEVDRYTRLTALAVVAMVFVASVAMWGFWPSWNDDSKVANFHIVATDVAWNSQNQNQLIANIYFQNDAGDADVSTYSATAFSPNAENKALIDQLRKNVTQIQHENKALHFNVKSKEIKWFTIPGAVLPNDIKDKYIKGELIFYFFTTIIIDEHGTIKPMEFCAFVSGNNPNATIQYPIASSP